MKRNLFLFLSVFGLSIHLATAQSIEFVVDLSVSDCYLEDMTALRCNGVTGTLTDNSVRASEGVVLITGVSSGTTNFTFNVSGTATCPPPNGVTGPASVNNFSPSRTISINVDMTACRAPTVYPEESVSSGSSTFKVTAFFYPKIKLTKSADCSTVKVFASCEGEGRTVAMTWLVADNPSMNSAIPLDDFKGLTSIITTPENLQSKISTFSIYGKTIYFQATGKTGTTSDPTSVDIPYPALNIDWNSSSVINPTCPNGTDGGFKIVQNKYTATGLLEVQYSIAWYYEATCTSTPDGVPSGYCLGGATTDTSPAPASNGSEYTINKGTIDAALDLKKGVYVISVEGLTTGHVLTCPASHAMTLSDPPPMSVVTNAVQVDNPSCTGGNDASAQIVVKDGITPYKYSITPKSSTTLIDSSRTTSVTIKTNRKLSYSTSAYTFSVTDKCGTNQTSDFFISTDGSQKLGLQTLTGATETKATVTCYPSGVGDAYWTVQATNPKPDTGSDYKFSIYEGSGTSGTKYGSGSPNTDKYKFTGLGKSKYTIEVTAPNNCVNTIEKDFTLPKNLDGSFLVTDACHDQKNGSISFTRKALTGTAAAITIDVTGITAGTVTGSGDTYTMSGLDPGTTQKDITMKATDQCLTGNPASIVSTYPGSTTQSATVHNNNVLAIDAISSTIKNNTTYYVSCSTDRFSGSIVYKDGRGPYSVSVTKGTTAISRNHNTSTKTITVSNLDAGTYTVTITDGCDAPINKVTLTFTVDVPTDMTAAITPTNLTCFQNHSGQIQLTVGGGKPGADGNGAKNYTFKIFSDSTGTELTPAVGKSDCSPNNENCIIFTGLDARLAYRLTATDSNANAAHCTKNFNLASQIKKLTEPGKLTVKAITAADLTGEVSYSSQFYVTCKGDSNISLNAKVSGGTSPYTWYLAKESSSKWPKPRIKQTSNIFAGLGVDNYKIFVSDKNHCDSTGQPLVINESTNKLQVNTIHRYEYSHGANTSCYGYSDGKLDIGVSGGTGNYTYTLTSDAAYSNSVTKAIASHTFQSLPAINPVGDTITYTVALKDELGCTWTHQNGVAETIKLDPPDTVEFNWSVISRTMPGHEIPCHGDEATVRFTSEGGKFPHTITIGAITKPIDSLNHADFNLLANTYSPVITDAIGCPGVAKSVTLVEPATHVAIYAGAIIPPVCIGGQDGKISISANDGVPFITPGEEYLFLIKKNAAPLFDTDTLWGTTNTFLREANFYTSQDYVVQVRDRFDCFDEVSVTMPQNPSPLTLTHQALISPSCHGGNDGSIEVTASNYEMIGGTSLKFSLSGGHLGSTIQQVTVNSNNYTFTSLEGTDLNGYAPYRAWVEDANACSDTAYQYLDLLPLPSHDAIALDLIKMIRPSCFNGTDGSLELQVSGGVVPYNFSRDDTNYQAVAPTQTIFLPNLDSGNYTVYIRDANYKADQPACFSATTFTVENGRFIRLEATANAVSCKNGNNGAIDLSTFVDNRSVGENFDPTRLMVYWTHDNISSLPISAAEDLTDLSTGTYTVHASYNVDSLTCVNETSVIVREPGSAFKVSNVQIYNTSCGIHSDGKAVISVNGGWPDSLSYYRVDAGAWTLFTGSSFIITGLSAGSHTVDIAQSMLSCLDSKAFDIGSASLSISVSQQLSPACPMGADGVVVLQSATPSVEYALDGSTSFQSLPSFSGLSAGEYHFFARLISEPTCLSDIVTAIITDPSDCGEGPLNVTLLSNVAATCDISANGQAQVRASGGTPPYSFRWDGTSTTSDTKTDLTKGTHSVTVRDAMGDEQTIDINIDALQALNATAMTTLASCLTTCDGTITVFPSGGSGNFAIAWTDNVNSFSRNQLCAGDYTYTITDVQSSQCQVSNTVKLEHFPELDVTLNSAIPPVCSGGTDGSLLVSATGGSGHYQYQWDNTSISARRLEGVMPGTYTVIVTDNTLGCSLERTFTLPDATPITVDGVNTTAPLCHNGNDGTAQLSLSTVSSPLVKWSNGQIGLKAIGLPTSTVTYSITDSKGCAISGSVDIPDRPQLIVDEQITATTCFGSCNGSIKLVPSGGVSPYFVTWSHGPRTLKLNNLCKGSYSYSISDNNKCSIKATRDIQSPDEIKVTPTLLTPSCFGFSDGAASVSVTGGTVPYRYSWSTGATTDQIGSLTAGKYAVIVKDANDCQLSTPLTIGQPDALLLKNISIQNPSCTESTDGKISFDISGGSLEYSVTWNDSGSGVPKSNLTSGTYTSTITDSHQCILTRSFNVASPLSLEIVNVQLTDPVCNGDNNGSIALDILGGTQPYSFAWNNGIANQNLTSQKSGSYILVVKDKNNCSVEDEFLLAEPEIPVITGIPEKIIICTNSKAVAEPDGDWSKYQWTGPGSFSLDTKRFTSTEGGNYLLKAWDIKGCPGQYPFTVEVSANALTADFLRISEAVAFQPIVLVDISTPSPQTIEWIVPDDPNVTVDSDVNGVLELIFTEPGSYEIGMKASMDNCKAELYKIIEVELPSGRQPDVPIAGREEKLDLSLYPNPTRGALDLQINASSKDEIHVRLIRVLDSQPVRDETHSGYLDYLIQWDLSEASSGMYYMIYEQHGKTKSKKLIIVK